MFALVASVGCYMLRGLFVAVALFAVSPAFAGELTVEEARHLVVGKLFSYNCFEGTRGAGRVFADGSVVGTIQFQGSGPVRRAFMPTGTIKVKGAAICASLRGLPMEPCFSLERTDQNTFRGSVSGLRFAYCDFTRHNGRAILAGGARRSQPLQLRPALTAAAKD